MKTFISALALGVVVALSAPAFAGSNVSAYVGDMLTNKTAAPAPDTALRGRSLRRAPPLVWKGKGPHSDAVARVLQTAIDCASQCRDQRGQPRLRRRNGKGFRIRSLESGRSGEI